jgi:four helix bundle protein
MKRREVIRCKDSRICWFGKKPKDLAVQIYKNSETGKIGKDFGLRDQLRRSAISVPSNLAEGDERNTDKESIRFFYIAKGSLAELRTQIQIGFEVGYFEKDIFKNLDKECEKLGKMIGALIKARKAVCGLVPLAI